MKTCENNNLHFENHNKKPLYSYEDYAHALSEDGDRHADAIIDEIPYIKMFLGKYPGEYALVSSQHITSGFGFIFQKGSPLVEDVSREIAKMRLDGTLETLEKKWFEEGFLIPSRNSTHSNILKLDSFGGVFISNAVSLALALIIAYAFPKLDIENISLELMFRAFKRLGLKGSSYALFNLPSYGVVYLSGRVGVLVDVVWICEMLNMSQHPHCGGFYYDHSLRQREDEDGVFSVVYSIKNIIKFGTMITGCTGYKLQK
ncbi:Extracellular ligand-binding receptor [Artemisia annua]|uniref:Extracellular ligand-binding receptor n=1 Tax=Artemisia annua TaxID=35608 RepID=A0A2U1MNN2_ARTAN|nr:Extracellular ligand-binding receptor [Artemisia annua]